VPASAAPSVASTFQAWAAPGSLGPRPTTPAAPKALSVHAAPVAPPAPVQQWDQAALIAALNQMTLQGQSNNDTQWIFDSSASSHMGYGSGIITSPHSPHSPSHIIIGDGSPLPITGTGSAHFTTSTRPYLFSTFLFLPNSSKI
jgi:hypothetical protein